MPGTNIDTAEKEMQAYNSLMTWLNGEAKEILAGAQDPVTDRESEFMVKHSTLTPSLFFCYLIEYDSNSLKLNNYFHLKVRFSSNNN